VGQAHVQRRQGERPVGDHLDRRAAVAKQDHRTELRVFGGADDQLVRIRAPDHRLHDEAIDPGLGRGLGDAAAQRLDRCKDLVRVRQVEGDAADVGLVRDVARKDFERDRKPDLMGGGHCLLGVGYSACIRHRDAVRGEQIFRLGLGQPLSSTGEGPTDHGARRSRVRNELLRH
jgi:hypothetical protein